MGQDAKQILFFKRIRPIPLTLKLGNPFFLLMLVFLIELFSPTSFGGSSGESEEMASWGGKERITMGVAINPPKGRVKAQVRMTEQYIRSIIENLAGPLLKEKGFDLEVKLYANDKVNMFVRKVSAPDGSIGQLKEILDWKVIKANQKVELGVWVGILDFFETESELAFVVGHEMMHVLEGHLKNRDGTFHDVFSDWFSGQAEEVVADGGSFHLMVGKYELDDGIRVLQRLHQIAEKVEEKKNDSILDGILGGTSTHHDAGVRITEAQAIVRELRRTDEAARKRPSGVLPSYIRNLSRSRVGLSQKEALDLAERIGLGFEDRRKYLSQFRNGQNQYLIRDTLVEKLLDSFESSLETLEARKAIEALLDLGDLFPREIPDNLSDQQRHRLMKVLLNLKDISAISLYDVERLLLPSRMGQTLLYQLGKLNPEWSRLIDKIPSSVLEYGAEIKNRLARFGSSVFVADGVLRKQILNGVLDALSTLSVEKMFYANLSGGDTQYKNFSFNEERFNGPEYHQEYIEQVRKEMPRFDRAFIEIRNSRFIELLEGSDSKANRSIGLDVVFNDVPELAMDPSFLRDIEPLVLGFISRLLGEKVNLGGIDFIYVFDFLIGYLNHQGLTSSQRIELLDYLLHDASNESGAPKHYHVALISSPSSFDILNSETLQFWMNKLLEKSKNLVFHLDNKGETDKGAIAFFSLYNFLTADKSFSNTLAKQVKIDDFKMVLKIFRTLNSKKIENLKAELVKHKLMSAGEANRKFAGENHLEISSNLGVHLLSAFANLEENYSSFQEWVETLSFILNLNKDTLFAAPDLRRDLERSFLKRLAPISAVERVNLLENKQIFQLLSSSSKVALFMDHLRSQVQGRNIPKKLMTEVQKINERFELQAKFPQIYLEFANRTVKEFKIQPNTIAGVFPEIKEDLLETVYSHGGHIRVMSALAALVRTRNFDEQWTTIDYLLGRSTEIPKYIQEASAKTSKYNFLEMVQSTRDALVSHAPTTRAVAVSTLIAGQGGLGASPKGHEYVINKLLDKLAPQIRPIAKSLARALIRAESPSEALAVASMVAAKDDGKNASNELNEGVILRNLFESYGVPGKKLGQYMAFVEMLGEYSHHLVSLQDSASPLSDFALIRLLNKRYGADWPSHYIVLNAEGFGTVRIAMRVLNLETMQEEVLNFLRDEIELATEDDFRRFNQFTVELIKDEYGGHQFDYLVGLSKIIQRSVSLEFDANHTFDMLKVGPKYYQNSIGGWTIRIVKANSNRNGDIFMEFARGITARALLAKDPTLYKETMSYVSDHEMHLLTSEIPPDQKVPVNPDFHDGQVFIEPVEKLITIIDPGQAEFMIESQRLFAVQLLGIISSAFSPSSAAQKLNSFFGKIVTDASSIGRILQAANGNKMDAFIKIISDLELRGASLPGPVIDWVWAADKQVKLGQKIKKDNQARFQNLVLKNNKISIATGVIYNQTHATTAAVKPAVSKLLEPLQQGLQKMRKECSRVLQGR
jgi:hypothetical protein